MTDSPHDMRESSEEPNKQNSSKISKLLEEIIEQQGEEKSKLLEKQARLLSALEKEDSNKEK